MNLLLDTHAFLWWVEGAPALSKRARKIISDEDNRCFLSLASSWEISIKVSLGKLKLPSFFDQYIPQQLAANGFIQLQIEFRHVARVSSLPFHHCDPFDRLLVAQAMEEKLVIVTADPMFRKYGVKQVW